MTEDVKKGIKVVLNMPAQIAHPLLTRAAAEAAVARGLEVNDFGGKLILTLDHMDLPAINAALVQAAKDVWPGRALTELRFPLKDGTKLADKAEKRNREYFRGHKVLTIKAPLQNRKKEPLQAPAVFDIRSPSTQLPNGTAEEMARIDRLVFSGAYVCAQLNFKGTKGNGSNIQDGVTCYLNALIFVKDGERIGGFDGATVFSGIIGRQSAESPTAGMSTDEEIPF